MASTYVDTADREREYAGCMHAASKPSDIISLAIERATMTAVVYFIVHLKCAERLFQSGPGPLCFCCA
jgi:hypothetical protein